MRAGLAVLPHLEKPEFYEDLNRKAKRLADGFRAALAAAGVPGRVNLSGSLLTMFFGDGEIRNYSDAKSSRTQLYPKFFHGMLDRGIFLAPSQFEALFVSAAHTDADIDRTIAAAQESLQLLR